MKPFVCVETTPILKCNDISFKSFKNEITNKLFTHKSYVYIHLKVGKQITIGKLLLLHSNTWNYLTMCKQMINNE